MTHELMYTLVPNPVDHFSSPLLQHRQHQRMSLDQLPAELVSEIARFLASDHKHRSLANLNQACHRLRHATVSALYRTLVLFRTEYERLEEDTVLESIGEGDPVPDAWKHTQ
jgi:hypothetical protein